MNRRLVIFLILVIIFPYNMFISRTVLKMFFSEKIWVHKVNSTEDLDDVSQSTVGVELDVVFDSGTFDIHHPPEKRSGLSLMNYLSTSSNKDLRYWLDFKNLNAKNSKTALVRLNEVLLKNMIVPANVIVESSDILMLQNFAEAGYVISCYLPFEFRKETSAKYSFVNDQLYRLPEACISSDYRDYFATVSVFPDREKMFWISEIWFPYGIFGLGKIFITYKALLDEKVVVILLPK